MTRGNGLESEIRKRINLNTEMKTLLPEIVKLAKETGLTQTDLSEIMGVSAAAVSRWFSEDVTKHRGASRKYREQLLIVRDTLEQIRKENDSA